MHLCIQNFEISYFLDANNKGESADDTFTRFLSNFIGALLYKSLNQIRIWVLCDECLAAAKIAFVDTIT